MTNKIYDSLGIKSIKNYYQDKFMGGTVGDQIVGNPSTKFNIQYIRAKLFENIKGKSKILDIGCGSGVWGKFIKSKGIKQLVGVDISKECLKAAKTNGYELTYVCDVLDGLPFPNGEFDYVISMDFFGHVEKQHKDKIISEIKRVLKNGGTTLHGIEEGYIDYDSLDLKDKNNPVVQYILKEGHVGIEPKEEIKKRWEKFFHGVSVENPFVYPCFDYACYVFGGEAQWDKDFIEIIKNFSQREIEVFNIAMGFINQQLCNIVKEEQRSSGFIFLSAIKNEV